MKLESKSMIAVTSLLIWPPFEAAKPMSEAAMMR